jgi:ADP-heptose:LPS heptosyltransferase
MGGLPLGLFNHVPKWIFGEDALYRLKHAGQENCYHELHKYFHLPGKYAQPELYKALHEELSVEMKIQSRLPSGNLLQSSVIFSPTSNRKNRSLREDHILRICQELSSAFPRTPLLLLDRQVAYFAGKRTEGLIPLSIREFLIAVSRCKAVVTVDTATLHIAAAWKKPTLALMGPFSPLMRTITYPTVTALWDKAACPQAPCCWHDIGSAPDCAGTAGSCFVLDSVTPESIINFLKPHLTKP